MKIKYLWISKYKNLEDLEFKFESDLISLLIGKNGLGKSNSIEVLALIFRDLDLVNKKEDFENWAYEKDHFEYLINYECRDFDIKIECKESSFQVYVKDKISDQAYEELSFADFRNRKADHYLPKYVIGYYSGENDRI